MGGSDSQTHGRRGGAWVKAIKGRRRSIKHATNARLSRGSVNRRGAEALSDSLQAHTRAYKRACKGVQGRAAGVQEAIQCTGRGGAWGVINLITKCMSKLSMLYHFRFPCFCERK